MMVNPEPSAAERPSVQLAADAILTEPLNLTQLAISFGVHRNKMASILRNWMDRRVPIEQHGRLYRVPIAKMPQSWLLSRGVLLPTRLDGSAAECTPMHNPS
jgi:hypothetical protein